MISREDLAKSYRTPLSLSNWLPWVEYVEEDGVFVLEDDYSVGVLFEVMPVAVEARGDGYVSKIDIDLQNLLNSVVPLEDPPYVLDIYAYDEPNLNEYYKKHEEFVWSKSFDPRYKRFTESYLEEVRRHMTRISDPKGVFIDDVVTKGPWHGLTRRVMCFLHRRLQSDADVAQGKRPADEMNETFSAIQSALSDAGITAVHQSDEELYEWLFPWFNEDNEIFEGNKDSVLERYPYPKNNNELFGDDFASSLFLSQPISNAEENKGYWDFDGSLHKGMTIDNLRTIPKPGQVSAELQRGDKYFALLDSFPQNTILCMSVVFTPKDYVESRLMEIKKNAKGDHHDARAAATQVEKALVSISDGNMLYPCKMSVLYKATNEKDLQRLGTRIEAVLATGGFKVLREREDLLPVNTYVRSLPGNYDFSYDVEERRSRFIFSSHISKIFPFYGRSRGTPTAGIPFYNRGAETIGLDFIADRVNNAFGLILGPPGSGKSSLLVLLINYFIAVHNARVFILEKGGSFRLLGQSAMKLGLSVNQVTLSLNADYALAPFADAISVGADDEESKPETEEELAKKDEIEETTLFDMDSDEDDEYKRDYLGEMELAARVMITGGEAKEENILMRADRVLIRNAIKMAGKEKYLKFKANPEMDEKEKIVLPGDVADCLDKIAKDQELPDQSRLAASRMAMNMRLFCDGVAGHFFNRPGTDWEESDVTILEFGILSQEGYEDQLALAFMSLMNRIAFMVERDEADQRPTIIIGDEAHLFIKNPLLAIYLVKIIKMFRKLGTWPWLATQNCEDFTDESNKMLSMFEWLIAMTPPKGEIDNISNFRDLSEDEKALMRATRKSPKKYTEGVVLSDQVKALVRNVPPAYYLAQAMTEKDEKATRKKLMDEHGVNELESVRMISDAIEGIA